MRLPININKSPVGGNSYIAFSNGIHAVSRAPGGRWVAKRGTMLSKEFHALPWERVEAPTLQKLGELLQAYAKAQRSGASTLPVFRWQRAEALKEHVLDAEAFLESLKSPPLGYVDGDSVFESARALIESLKTDLANAETGNSIITAV